MKPLDPRIKRTLKILDRALLENLKKHPFSKITVEMICNTAEVNRSTFYKYYCDKYDHLETYLQRTFAEFQEVMDASFILAQPMNIGDEQYKAIFHDCLVYLDTHRDEYVTLWNATLDVNVIKKMVEIVHNNMIKLMNNNPYYGKNHKLYIDLYAELFAANLMTMTQWWFVNYRSLKMDEVEEIMSDNMSSGLFAAFKKRLPV